MWQPWIGSRFSERRILLLGESCYDWEDEHGVRFEPKPNHPVEVIEAVRRNPKHGAATIKKLTRAVCRTETPTASQSAERWDCFAFTNYVPISAGFGPKVKPTEAAWAQAEKEWPLLLKAIQPKAILVLGKGLWGYMPTTQRVESKNVQGYSIEGADIAMCCAVQHPSFGPSWSAFLTWITALERYVDNGDCLDEVIRLT